MAQKHEEKQLLTCARFEIKFIQWPDRENHQDLGCVYWPHG